MARFSPLRAAIVMGLIATLLVGMTGRVAYLQTYGRQDHIQSAEGQQHTSERILARPGSIFDRNGIAMAGTVQTLAVYLDPEFMLEQYQANGRTLAQMNEDLRKLAALIDRQPGDLLKIVSERAGSEYVRVAEHRDERVCQEIRRLNIPGVGIEPVCVRYYPMGSLAAHVLGTVGRDGRGLEGLELKFQQLLAGKNGFKRIEKDARKRPIGVDAADYVPPVHGQHLVVTIDSNIQMIAEQELAAACEKFQAKRGEVIIMDPRTGDVLAMANYPTFNPQILDESTAEMRLNRCIVVPYEPGSVLKPFIVGPALAWGITRVSEKWHTASPYTTPYGRRVSDVHSYESLATWDVLVKSSNIGMSLLAERMGNANLHKSLRLFGFGQPTGIDLPGEDQGLLNPFPSRKWSKHSTESVAQGYEMMVTPMQLARAFCVYANGGRLPRPRLIRGVLDADGNIIERQPSPRMEDVPEVVDSATAQTVRQVLSDVLVRGTASRNRSKTWNIFGKTGTAHISMGRRGYSPNLYNSSFIAGAPLEDPRLVIAMTLHEADRKLGYYGGTVTAPASVRILERSLAYLQVPASPPLPPPPPQVASMLYNFNAKLYEVKAPAGGAR